MVDKSPEYLMNKGGVFYFTRHVPNDLQQHYERPRIVMCLRTASKKAALKASLALVTKLDAFWLKCGYRLLIPQPHTCLSKGRQRRCSYHLP